MARYATRAPSGCSGRRTKFEGNETDETLNKLVGLIRCSTKCLRVIGSSHPCLREIREGMSNQHTMSAINRCLYGKVMTQTSKILDLEMQF